SSRVPGGTAAVSSQAAASPITTHGITRVRLSIAREPPAKEPVQVQAKVDQHTDRHHPAGDVRHQPSGVVDDLQDGGPLGPLVEVALVEGIARVTERLAQP